MRRAVVAASHSPKRRWTIVPSRSRDDTLAILRGQPIARLPVFGGLPSLTAPGLSAAGIRYGEAHTDPTMMARAAASTYETFGFESAVVPFDLCVEAEALGCGVDFQTDVDAFLAPVVSAPLRRGDQLIAPTLPDDPSRAGRIPIVCEALTQLKNGVGREVAIGAWIPGPFTLAWQLFGAEAWLMAIKQDPTRAAHLLESLAEFLARVGARYREAGADLLTIHEMGGSPQVVGASTFRSLVQPALTRLIAALPSPRVLSVCGDTNKSVADLAACGAEALNVDHRNDLARTRQALGPTAILLGNFDPVKTLSQGTPETIAQAVRAIADAGANAVWPGCDLWPEMPEANFRALISAARDIVTPERRPTPMNSDNLEEFWEDLLSEEPARIRRVWKDLTDEECAAVLDHLRRMTEEEGWHAAQKQAAATALHVIREQAE